MIKKFSLSIISMIMLISINSAMAEVIFSCNTTHNKKIEVKDSGAYIQYKFGINLDKPELSLSVPREKASTGQWNGVGRDMEYEVTIPNGNTNYTVFFSVDKSSAEHTKTAGVRVLANDKYITTVYCRSSTLIQSLEGINLKETE
ncbi:hypothetical protein [Celerinatantimonas sp. MCCC 1A17872]|uniref:hypothetical protein n=1 Tax=Celerinatantimonas sp. MCCC 1A17872 TaxID=3177514 RepID=UPI0038BEDCE2